MTEANDSSGDTGDRGRQRAALGTMQRLVEDYTPRMAAEHWAPIEDFVRSTVLATRPEAPYATKTLLSSLSAYVLWCWQTACVPLTYQDVFTPSLIEEWVTSGCPST